MGRGGCCTGKNIPSSSLSLQEAGRQQGGPPVRQGQRPRVTFDTVQIREYPIVLSDNPASVSGPAIELGWEYRPASDVKGSIGIDHRVVATTDEDGRISVQDYETIKPSPERRSPSELYLPTDRRRRILSNNATTNHILDHDMYAAEAVKEQIHHSRARSNAVLLLNPIRRTRDAWSAQFRTMKIRRALITMNQSKKKLELDNHKNDKDTTSTVPPAGVSPTNIYRRWWIPVMG